VEPPALGDLGDLLPKQCIFSMFHVKFYLKTLITCSLLRLCT